MSKHISAGTKFRIAVKENNPLQILGTINAYSAILAEQSGAKALYLSGAGVANASLGLPDLAISTLNDVLIDAQRITDCCQLPLLVDVDTGWGGAFNISRMIKQLIKAEVAAIHIEDQVSQKRCGHRPGKALVSAEEMNDRLKAAVDARTDESFVIMARTDSFQQGGINEVIDRANQYILNGADMLFVEALSSLSDYQKVCEQCQVPILANITEFGKTPLFSTTELSNAGVKMALYPLSAFRAMNKAALNVYQTIIKEGTQKSILSVMQDRNELYHYLGYHEYETKLDRIFGKNE